MFHGIETIAGFIESSTLRLARNVTVVLYNIRVQTAVQGNAINDWRKESGPEGDKEKRKWMLRTY